MTESPESLHCGAARLCLRPLLRRAYGLFWDHARVLIAAHVAIVLILLIGNQLLTVGGNVLLGPFILGFYKISLLIVRNKDTELADLLSGFEYFLPAFVANILIHLIAFVLGWFLIIPGLLALLSYSLTYFFMLDDNLGFWDAMEASRKMVWGNFKRWLAIGAVFFLVNLAGLACCGVGVLVSFPFGHLLFALAYEEELKEKRRREEAGETGTAQGLDDSLPASPVD